jgi:competence protein ComEC
MIKLKKHFVFIFCCLSFILGIVLFKIIKIDIFYFFSCALIGLLIFILNKKYYLLFLITVFLFLGALRLQVSLPNKEALNFVLSFTKQERIIFGEITTSPEIKLSYQQVILNNLKIENQKIDGAIIIFLPKFEEYKIGQQINLNCQIEKPEIIKSDWKDFNYANYLALKNVYAICKNSKIISIENTNSDFLLNSKIKLESIKNKIKSEIDKNLPYPHSAFLNAMFLGVKGELPKEISNKFSQTGLSHVLAISGLHIGILALLLFYTFIFLRIKRGTSFWIVISILFLYVAMVGFKASMIRAFVMTFLGLYSLKIGRLNKVLSSLIIAGTILLLINSKLILYDIGFQLSFSAVLGIILLFEPIKKLLKFLTDKFKIRDIVSVTLSAQIATLPLIIYYFGIMSLISPISNLLVLGILPFILAFAILFSILIFIWSKAGIFIGIILWLMLEYVLEIAELLSKIPFSFIKFY